MVRGWLIGGYFVVSSRVSPVASTGVDNCQICIPLWAPWKGFGGQALVPRVKRHVIYG